jgi:putative FmdB family regulatory protein
MPLYEYSCEACGAKEEKLQSFSAPTSHDCPKCGQVEAMHREISRTAFVLSGSGWYAGGYAGSDKAPSEGSEAPSAGSGPRKDGEGAKVAPAAKTDTEAPASPSDSKAACASGCACHSPKVEAATKPD